jgi:hypothetical protein
MLDPKDECRYTGHYHKYLFSLNKLTWEKMRQKKLNTGLTWNQFFEKYLLNLEED